MLFYKTSHLFIYYGILTLNLTHKSKHVGQIAYGPTLKKGSCLVALEIEVLKETLRLYYRPRRNSLQPIVKTLVRLAKDRVSCDTEPPFWDIGGKDSHKFEALLLSLEDLYITTTSRLQRSCWRSFSKWESRLDIERPTHNTVGI